MANENEILGRLAALEITASMGLYTFGRDYAASGWPQKLGEVAQKAKDEVLPTLPNDEAKAAAAEALDRMFNRSASRI